MKAIYSITLVSFSLLFLFSCSEDESQSIIGNWELNGFVESYDSISRFSETAYPVTFSEDKTIVIQLDINSCSGSYSLDREDLEINDLACTEACCDSSVGSTFANLMIEVNSYKISNNQLNLYGPEGLIIRLDPAE